MSRRLLALPIAALMMAAVPASHGGTHPAWRRCRGSALHTRDRPAGTGRHRPGPEHSATRGGGRSGRPVPPVKEKLPRGGTNVLNVYTAGLSEGLLGYSTLTWEHAGDSLDGVVLLYSTLPGAGTGDYSQGDTLTHEVGHWMGLWHTFQDGCSDPNDYVADTRPRLRPPITARSGVTRVRAGPGRIRCATSLTTAKTRA